MPRGAKLGLLLGAAFACGTVVGPSLRVASAAGDEPYPSLARFTRAFHFVLTSWVGEAEPSMLVRAAISGMVGALDRHSRYVSAEDLAKRDVDPSRAGHPGLSLERTPRGWVIMAVAPRSGAARGGLLEGDRVLAVDDLPLEGATPARVDEALRGAPGTSVQLKVARDPEPVRVPVLRQVSLEPTVFARRLAGGRVHLRIFGFAESTAAEVERALAAQRRAGPIAALVLDLRGNTGGLVESAINIADLWLSEGVILTTRARGRDPQVAPAHPRGTEPGYPMVVLIDEATASASEALAAALRDHKRARLVGKKSFGKASVQTTLELDDGSILRLTTARYYTPSGRFLEGEGLTPDVVLSEIAPEAGVLRGAIDSGHADPALDRALEAVSDRSPSRAAGSFTGPEARAISNP